MITIWLKAKIWLKPGVVMLKIPNLAKFSHSTPQTLHLGPPNQIFLMPGKTVTLILTAL